MAQIFKGLQTRGISPSGIVDAFHAKTIPEAIVKGHGNAYIIKAINNLAGNPIGALPLSYTIPGLGLTVSIVTLINYFLLTGMQLRLDINALVGALSAVATGVNPTGPSNAVIVRTSPNINPLGGFGGG